MKKTTTKQKGIDEQNINKNRRFFFMRKAHRYNSQAPDRTPFLLPPSKTRTNTQSEINVRNALCSNGVIQR